MYLKNYNLQNMFMLKTDVLVIGSGVAGLSCVMNIKKDYSVLVVSKTNDLESGSTLHAQGGIAVVLKKQDDFKSHINDTLIAGNFLNNKKAVKILVKEGPNRIKDLIDIGMNFDRKNNELEFTREGAHSNRRILHASGDATGYELETTLVENLKKIQYSKNIHYKTNFIAIDLLTQNNICYGVIGYDITKKDYILILAKAVVLASGGIGKLYRETTNPEEITGDGIAMAYRTGAQVTDMEFVQFHPTTLYIAGAPRFLISESVRGEGAYLKNVNDKRFMFEYDERGELASRDIVSKAIHMEMKKNESSHVYLDLTHLNKNMIKERFPNIRKVCKEYGVDILNQQIPVRPGCHYFMGGIKTDLFGKTNIKNLFAVGECSCNGVHGANRLASNSLLEGLVFGYRTAKSINDTILKSNEPDLKKFKFNIYPKINHKSFNISDASNALKSLMWREVGINRKIQRLDIALRQIKYWKKYVLARNFSNYKGIELQNMLILGELIIKSALWRKESRGAHFLEDYPEKNKKYEQKHYIPV